MKVPTDGFTRTNPSGYAENQGAETSALRARVEPLIGRIRREMDSAGLVVESSKGECNDCAARWDR